MSAGDHAMGAAASIERSQAEIISPKKDSKKDNKDFLVDPENYTTDGGIYHKKYRSTLIDIANLIKKNSMDIGRQSVGFYYDRNTNERDKLYVGIDIIIDNPTGADYGTRAKSAIYNNLEPVMESVNAHRELFKEKQIVGMVIGFKWKDGGKGEQINIWINESDADRYKDNKMTFNEIVQRSFLTNGQGRIIILR
jgi:hypothetical protein